MPETNVSHSYQASSLEEQQAAYDRWAKDYEADLCAMGYRIPAMIAARVLADKPCDPDNRRVRS